MHMSPRSLLGAALASLLFIFSSCIDIEQYLTIHEDGSATLHIRYIFDEEALELQELIDPDDELFTESEIMGMIDTNAVSLRGFNESRQNGLRIVDMIYEFKDINLLSVRWCDEHNYVLFDDFKEYSLLTWSYASGEESKEESDSAMHELEEFFSDHYCTFTVELPFEITDVDESATVSTDRHTARWKFPMIDFMKGDTLRLRAKFKKS
jgi:hypothetical protein